MGRRFTLFAVAVVALACAAAATARTPAQRHLAATRLAASQWKPWWGTQQWGADGSVTLASLVPTSAGETHSALITTKRTWQDNTISFSTTTLRQLRTGSAPNTWEVGWLMFRFKDLENYYWFMVKTNGFELGKKQGSDTQHFLVTGDLPAAAVGATSKIRVVAEGPRIQVFVGGSKIVDYLDPKPLLGTGSVGLYEEDSQVRFSSLSIS